MSCFTTLDSLCRKIVSPTRPEVDEAEMIDRKFKGKPPAYHLVKVGTRRGQNLSVLLFPRDMQRAPTVLYLHGNGGNKLEVLSLLKHSFDVNFCAFDFSGCGQSDGEFVTYGEKQVEDIEVVVSFLRDYFGVRRLSVWGRSMGASLGLMYAAQSPPGLLACMVLDSPFPNLSKVLFNVASSNQSTLPQFLISLGVFLLKRRVEGIVSKDVFSCDYSSSLPVLSGRNLPLLFAFSTRDTVVTEEDVLSLYDQYEGQKSIFQLSNLHPDDRSAEFINSGLRFVRDQHSRKKLSIVCGLRTTRKAWDSNDNSVFP